MSFITDDDRNARDKAHAAIESEVQRVRPLLLKEIELLAEEIKQQARRLIREGREVSYLYVSSDDHHLIPISSLQVADELSKIGLELVTGVFDKALDMQFGKDYRLRHPEKVVRFIPVYSDADDAPPSGVGVDTGIDFTPPLC